MWIVRLALRRPYTFIVMAILIAILGTPRGGAATLAAYNRASAVIAAVSVIAAIAGLLLIPGRRPASRPGTSAELALAPEPAGGAV